MLNHPIVSCFVGLSVVRHVFAIQLTGTPARQITVFRAQAHTAFAQNGRVKCGVVVRCDVEIVGHNDRCAIARCVAEGRSQYAGLAFVAQRYAQVRAGQNWYVFKYQRGVARDALIGILIQNHRIGFDVPIGVFRLTGGVARLREQGAAAG